MSLIGFKPTNHPQQVGKRGASDRVDERITPAWLYESYHARFGFTLDAAANEANAKAVKHFDLESDGLTQPWAPHRVWCNPPYSNLGGWLAKAHAEFQAGCPVIVMLLPANRTEQAWWQDHIEPYRDRGIFMRVEFLRRRFNFGMPGNLEGKFHSSPPFGCVAVIFEAGI
ncbi:phage N-6-adenine-methyltransferase [Variovorax boronicumulans]|uniref:DNA N-6-adenine-methyltransferase n=1 Tax=Variovorax boronicumulans TaxID=436515 RepID=UPI0027866A30|nr:DNA N-6-adenine-methyltransferase [Variovorax boronicumulans]MDQ0035905.1 phage N-6-adenine-methyltransferase [Variovorax boronicumulans]